MITYINRPVWAIFKYFIETEKNFIWRFLTFLIYFEEKDNSIRQNLIFYFYIPINEVFFFIIGTALISLGYRFKFRIDIIILVLILLVYLFKIILYIVNQTQATKIYTTTDYYLFNHGLNIIHPLFNLNYFLIGMFFGLINYSIQKGITDLEKNNYQNIFLLTDSKTTNVEEEHSLKNPRTFSIDDIDIDTNKLNINKVKSFFEPKTKFIKNNKLSKNFTILDNKNKIINDINDINEDSNEALEKLILEKNEIDSKSIEYSDDIKQIPFLIWPIEFSNFHKKNKNKLILILIIIIAFFLIIFFINSQVIFTNANLNPESKEIIEEKKIVEELSFKKVIPKQALNIILLLDIEVAIFIIQWINLILYFKGVGVIRNFLNHIYWSFFTKSYFSFNLVSITIILCVFYINENAIKFNLSNIFLYAFIDLIFILIFTIAVYSCFELPFKKAFRLILKGKETLINEVDDNEYYEEEEKNEYDK